MSNIIQTQESLIKKAKKKWSTFWNKVLKGSDIRIYLEDYRRPFNTVNLFGATSSNPQFNIIIVPPYEHYAFKKRGCILVELVNNDQYFLLLYDDGLLVTRCQNWEQHNNFISECHHILYNFYRQYS